MARQPVSTVPSGGGRAARQAGWRNSLAPILGALGLVGVLTSGVWLRRARLSKPGELDRRERGEDSQSGAEQRAGQHVERVVHPQVDPRDGDAGGNGESVRAHAGAEDRDRGRGGEGRRRVTGGERGVLRDRHQRAEPWVGLGRAGAPEQVLERADHERRGEPGDPGGEEGERRTTAPEIAAEAETDQQRALHPPRREQHEQRREQGLLERWSGIDQESIELGELGEQGPRDGNRARLLLVVNGRASGIEDPERTASELSAILAELHVPAEAVVTADEAEMFEALRGAVATDRRVVLAGGDGSLHDAANAPLGRLPELAIVPAGRANNIARALHVPSDRARALAIAALAPALPLDTLRVQTPERSLFAVEAVSAGFQAQARSQYDGENSADLRQGVRTAARAVRRFTPFELRARLGDEELVSDSAAQLFLSNLPYFGFGFEVDPDADPTDGRLEAILFEASARRSLLPLAAAAYRGRHLGRKGVTMVSTPRAELIEPLPLVADAVPLGTTTATITVDRDRLRVAAPTPEFSR
jgi:diacylglycerol kinase (ATP)